MQTHIIFVERSINVASAHRNVVAVAKWGHTWRLTVGSSTLLRNQRILEPPRKEVETKSDNTKQMLKIHEVEVYLCLNKIIVIHIIYIQSFIVCSNFSIQKTSTNTLYRMDLSNLHSQVFDQLVHHHSQTAR